MSNRFEIKLIGLAQRFLTVSDLAPCESWLLIIGGAANSRETRDIPMYILLANIFANIPVVSVMSFLIIALT